MNRRLALLLALALATACASAHPSVTAPPAANRYYSTGNFALELDGRFIGWLDQVEGGTPASNAVVQKLGPDHILRKQLGSITYSEISFTCGAGMDNELLSWIDSCLSGAAVRHNGAIITTDATGRPVQRLEFSNALLSEIGFPKLDGSSKDMAKMSIKLSPLATQFVAVSGAAVLPSQAAQRQKTWLASNFRLSISGVDCTRVSRIDAFEINEKVIDSAGAVRDLPSLSGGPQMPSLKVTFSTASAQSFTDWAKAFNNKSANSTKSGSLAFLAPDLRTVICQLNLSGMGITNIAGVPAQRGDSIPRMSAQISVGALRLLP